MATTTASIDWYYSALHYLIAGPIDADSDTFIMGLSTSAYTPNQGTHTVLTDITNEVSGSGYARKTLASVAVTPSAEPFTSTQKFDCADPVFTASGGSIVARYYWVFDDTPTSPADPLLVYGELDSTPGDVTTTDGNTLTFTVNAGGLLTLTGAGA